MAQQRQDNIYKWITGFLTSIMLLGLPVFISGVNRPTREEVSAMIKIEAPVTVSAHIEEIKNSQNHIKVQQAVLASKLETILEAIKKSRE